MILFFICALIAAAVGYCFIRARRSRLENCVVYEATILGYEERIVKRGSMLTKQVKPSVKYNNGKRDVVAELDKFIPKRDYHYSNGETVEIRAYPELPKIFYFAETDEHAPYEAIVCFVIAGVFAVIGVLSIICFG